MSYTLTRREWLARVVCSAAGLGLGLGCQPLVRALQRVRTRPARTPTVPLTRAFDTALSLGTLQRVARENASALSEEIATLSGLNVIRGFFLDDTGDVVLLGERRAGAPRIHIDDLAVALRSAYRVSTQYDEAPGCSIDPQLGAKDPWRLQAVRVIGMPICRMARRHVDLDYELKLVGSGLKHLDGVRDEFSVHQSATSLCAEGRQPSSEIMNRFWFCARVPESPRFENDDRTVLIARPVEVQVLTERRLFNGGAVEAAASADPVADQFAREISAVLAAGSRWEYAELRNDYRVIELGRLTRYQQIPTETLAYFLREHQFERADVAPFVVGIRRDDQANAVCGGEVTVTATAVESVAHERSQSFSYRGGVDAGVNTPPEHFVRAPAGPFAELRRKVQGARPSTEALVWSF